MSDVGTAPLPTLLSWVRVAWTVEIDNALRGRVRQRWGDLTAGDTAVAGRRGRVRNQPGPDRRHRAPPDPGRSYVRRTWPRGGGRGRVDRRDALVTGLVPQDGGWRGTRPHRAQTGARLADPTTALPWPPMVLHRGGRPDGS